MSRRLKLLVFGLAAAVGLLIGFAWLVFERTVYDRGADTPAPAPAPAQSTAVKEEEAVVESVHGSVQRSAGSGWANLAKGDRLHADDSVRTGAGAQTELRIGENSRLDIEQGSQLAIRELTEKVHRFKLSRGHVHVDYKPSGERVLRIEGEGDEAVAETRAARFSVLSTGRSIAIATESGAVDLKAKGEKVLVEAGQQAWVRSGERPSAAEPIPAQVWLKVANAMAQAPEGICGEVRGTAPGGAEVTVDGQPMELDADGGFAARVPRSRRKSYSLVAIRDASGRTTTQKVPCADEIGSARDVALRWRKGSN